VGSSGGIGVEPATVTPSLSQKYTGKKIIVDFYTWVDDADYSTWVTKSAEKSTWVTISFHDIVTHVD